MAGFYAYGVGEFTGGFYGFVGEGFEFLRVGILDFDGGDLIAVHSEGGIEFDGPAGGFRADGHDASEFAGDGEFVGLGGSGDGEE